MDSLSSSFLSSLLISAAVAILLLFIFFSIFLLRVYLGKSITSSLYPPVMGTVFNQLLYFDRLYDKQTSIVRRYPTYRLIGLSNSEVHTADPQNIEHILKTSFRNYPKCKYQQEIVSDLFGDSIFFVDGEKWRQQRKITSFNFSTRVLRDFGCGLFRQNAGKLAEIISKFVETKQAFDIQDLLMRFTLDSIFKVGVGVDLNFLEGTNKEASEFIRLLDESSVLVYWREIDFLWKMKRFLNVGSEAVLKKNMKTMDGFLYGVIDHKRTQLCDEGDCNDQEDVLSRILMESKKDPSKITDRYVRDIILSFVIAGKDTTAIALAWFFYMMCKNPSIQEKIAQQVREIIDGNDHENVDDFLGKITNSTLDKMQYLHAALTESLRLYPSVPVDGRLAERDDVLPDGYRVKKGDEVHYVSYAMGRMPYLWGDDAEEFKPERWLQNGQFQPESPSKFVAFHAGPRTCLGKDFAYREMKIVTMVLLRFFKFQMEDEKKPVKYKTTFTLNIDGGLNLRAFSRLAP